MFLNDQETATDLLYYTPIQSQLSSFITGCTRGQLANRLEQWPAPTDQEVNQVTSAIYEAAFDLIATSNRLHAAEVL